MLNASQVESPGWWLNRLGVQLHNDTARLTKLWDYYIGKHPIPKLAGVRQDELQDWMKSARANWCELVVESLRERLSVVGFRVGDEGPEGDRDADDIWQRNNMDSESGLILQGALVYGRAYAMVGRDPDDESKALITPEHPAETITEARPGIRRRRAAGLKVFKDDWTGGYLASLYLPDRVVKFRSDKNDPQWSMHQESENIPWTVLSDEPNPLGAVPIVPFFNKATLLQAGRGEFENVLDIQDRINASLINLLSAMRYGAFRQRWATGLELDADPITGQAVEPFKLDIKKLWSVPAPDVKFGDFAETNLSGYIASVREGVKDLAAITRTPPHYLLGEVVNVSAAALQAAESGLVYKAYDRQRDWGESFEETMRLAGTVEGVTALTEAANAETLWRNPESRSMAELADAALKRKQVGVPFRQLAEDMGYTPAQIDRMVADKAAEDLLAAQQAALAAPPGLRENAANPPKPPPAQQGADAATAARAQKAAQPPAPPA